MRFSLGSQRAVGDKGGDMRKRILAVLIGLASVVAFAPAHADHYRQTCVPGDASTAGYQICVADQGASNVYNQGPTRIVVVYAFSADFSTVAGAAVECVNESEGTTYSVEAGVAAAGQLVDRKVNLVRGAPVACPIDP
jgi:hypothetical protein